MTDLMSIVYASKVTPGFQDSVEINKILNSARVNNRAKKVTGMLLCNLHYFLQALEGPKDSINQLYEIIANDQRHQDIIRLSETKIEVRKFEGWQMGFYLVQTTEIHDIPRTWTELTAPQAMKIFDKAIASSKGKASKAFYNLQ